MILAAALATASTARIRAAVSAIALKLRATGFALGCAAGIGCGGTLGAVHDWRRGPGLLCFACDRRRRPRLWCFAGNRHRTLGSRRTLRIGELTLTLVARPVIDAHSRRGVVHLRSIESALARPIRAIIGGSALVAGGNRRLTLRLSGLRLPTIILPVD
ncbi:MAG: hypothetical protein ABI648_15985, partial [Betaproteobacteria bacterium]